MKSTEDSSGSFCSGPEHDRRNQRRVALWGLMWGFSFVAMTLVAKKAWLPFGVTLAGILGTSVLGLATLLAHRRFLQQTDELRRKIEVEALALAFGVGLVGGLTYLQLLVTGTVPAVGFAYLFTGMFLTYSVGVLIGRRRYS